MNIQTVLNAIEEKYPQAAALTGGENEISVARDRFIDVMHMLHDDPALAFDMLIDIAAMDRIPRVPRFDIVYILLSTKDFSRLLVRLSAGEDEEVPSVSGIWGSGNWAEREVYDLMGIKFSNHPDLRRILTWKNFEGHPLRKDFPLKGKNFDQQFDPSEIQDY